MSQVTDYFCHVCLTGQVRPVSGFNALPRVTSDCRPWPSGGELGICTTCGMVQKLIGQGWRDEAGAIYAQYDIYHQSLNGAEQAVFDQKSGHAVPRSQRILKAVASNARFPASGRMIDVGCGNGAMLRAFSAFMPEWELNGLEPNLKDLEPVLKIRGVQQIYKCELTEVPGVFDVISMIHVLEHVENPLPFLVKAQNKLRPDGCLFIEVPYFPDNPYDLVIADHCTHFTVATLTRLLARAGLQTVAISTDIVAKEITAITKRMESAHAQSPEAIGKNIAESSTRAVEQAVRWLQDVISSAQATAKLGNFGLFGTSISANWLLGSLQNQIRFFVDEDPGRIGTTFCGCPVMRPKDAPAESHIYMVLPRELAERVTARLKTERINFHLPPPYENSLDDNTNATADKKLAPTLR